MPLSALALVLLAGLIHASWNIAAKKAGGDVRFAAFTTVVNCVAPGSLGLWLAWEAVPAWGGREWGLAGRQCLLHCGYYLMLLRGYRKADLTVSIRWRAAPARCCPRWRPSCCSASTCRRSAASASRGRHRRVLIAGGPALWRRSRDAAARARVHKGMVYGVGSGAFIAAYTVVDGYAVKVMLLSPILVDYVGSLFRLLVVAPPALRDIAEAKGALAPAMEVRPVRRHGEPHLLCAGAVRDADGAAVARRAGAGGVHAGLRR
jgi:hypothetical protein